MPILELRNVCKGFGSGNAVLGGVSMSINEGEFVSVVGFSGSGKTTLISLIAGFMKPDSGTILLDGEPILRPGPDRGVIFQNYSLLPWMTVFENVHLAVEAVASGLSRSEKKERADHFIRMVKLQNAAAKRPHELSGGMRQRVAVARCLAMDPKVLLLDEPFSALDALTRAELQDELARIWQEQRKTVVMITNDVDEAALLAGRIFPLTPGPGAVLGPEIRVNIAYPRQRQNLSLDPEYQRVRHSIVRFLQEERIASRAAKPPSIAEARQLQLEAS